MHEYTRKTDKYWAQISNANERLKAMAESRFECEGWNPSRLRSITLIN